MSGGNRRVIQSDCSGEDHPGVKLRKLVWEPLETSLADAETVLISPDGPLCRFPFAALPGTQPTRF
jgi:hypothetical protein